MKTYYSEFLFARPSFLEGWARLFDFSGSLNEYNRSKHPDSVAQWADWTVVGTALRESMSRFAEENPIRVS